MIEKCLSVDGSLPSTIDIIKFRAGLCTNWSTFYSDVLFDHKCELIRHIPVFVLGSGRFPNVMVVFRPKDGELACLIGTSVKSNAKSIFASVGTKNSPISKILMDL